jgi:UDP-glucose:(heptosyl)LPS alpha-1,3-glucosyltransferase
MKIAFIRYKYDPFGGAERFTQTLAERLSARGVEVHLYARRWSAASGEGIVLHRVGGPSWPAILGYASFVFLVGRAVRRERFDLVQSNERTLRQDVYRAGDGVHARWLELRARRMSGLRRLSLRVNPFHAFRLWVERRLLEDPRLRAVIVNSEMVREEILTRFRIDPARIFTVPNGVDLQRFHPVHRETVGADLRRGAGAPGGEMVVLFVGSGFERKGLEFALRGLAEADIPARLWVVGKGKTGHYVKLARDLGLAGRVRFWGPRGDVAPLYAAGDVLVLPTLYDPFPSVALEAMASGLPVITTAQCGAAGIMTHGREGFILAEPEETRGIAEGLRILADGDARRRMGRAARARAEAFSWERTVGEMEALYDRLLWGEF